MFSERDDTGILKLRKSYLSKNNILSKTQSCQTSINYSSRVASCVCGGRCSCCVYHGFFIFIASVCCASVSCGGHTGSRCSFGGRGSLHQICIRPRSLLIEKGVQRFFINSCFRELDLCNKKI